MIEYLTQTGSTNADLAARLAAGDALREGVWLVADRQIAGRGRLGRKWFDGAGNFMGSSVVRPSRSDPAPGALALVAGLAVHEVVSAAIPPPQRALLKWPNDLLIGNAKLAGILLERTGDVVIVGIGVNLAQAPELAHRPAIALSAFGPAPDRNTFAEALARQFAIELERWRNFGLESVVARWLAAAHPLGTAMIAGEGSEQVSGAFIGLDGDGALQLRLANGTTRTIHAGEVRLAMSK